ncbi:hypothetical protein DSM106972_014280 [Dulcicalothrix desertica PCC 7102]|uniref:Uncharacterized protein n=1 Tax=Dulcicalothrix desertica PCC 7102 TaxID=232991 RepID=A0A433VQ81_9CYAN|nr:hypothetical protein DSM106972_014280 [Dulcicalothrix desertica PCC 7102]
MRTNVEYVDKKIAHAIKSSESSTFTKVNALQRVYLSTNDYVAKTTI